MLLAERDENTCRKDFTVSEAVELGELIEKRIAAEAKKRQKEHGNTAPGRKKDTSSDSDEVSEDDPNARRTDTRTADAVGVKRDRYAKAKEVVQQAKEEPEKYGDLVTKMDETGNVNAAYRELKRRQQPEPPLLPFAAPTLAFTARSPRHRRFPLPDPPWPRQRRRLARPWPRGRAVVQCWQVDPRG